MATFIFRSYSIIQHASVLTVVCAADRLAALTYLQENAPDLFDHDLKGFVVPNEMACALILDLQKFY